MRDAPPEPTIFFPDECADGPSIAEPLRSSGLHIRRYRDFFRPGVPDDDWIPFVAERGWVILTIDTLQAKRPLELIRLNESAAREFVVRGKGITGAERARRIIVNVKRIVAISNSQPAPFIAYVTRNRVELKYSKRRLRDLVRSLPRHSDE